MEIEPKERRYALLVNPGAGTASADRKVRKLRPAMEVLRVNERDLWGLDTKSPEEFRELARQLAESGYYDYEVFCGGDGTLSDGLNMYDDMPPSIPLAFLPFGNGNAFSHSTGSSARDIVEDAQRIADGVEHKIDLILCSADGVKPTRALFGGVGIEAYVLGERAEIQEEELRTGKRSNGLLVYGKSTWRVYMGKCNSHNWKRIDAGVSVDGREFIVKRNLTTIVSKVPCWGYGMTPVPLAELADGKLHILGVSDPGLWGTARGIAGCFLGEGNIVRYPSGKTSTKIGHYDSGERVIIDMPEEVLYQTDGTCRGIGQHFEFSVEPRALRMIY
ncbi:MAG: diacylglycerol kinase family protein [Candidatus Pacearchaeota archaeon]|jgi:diacylglycerol kinase family enzyme